MLTGISPTNVNSGLQSCFCLFPGEIFDYLAFFEGDRCSVAVWVIAQDERHLIGLQGPLRGACLFVKLATTLQVDLKYAVGNRRNTDSRG